MKRRTVLQGVAIGSVSALAGCLDGVREHFGIQGNVPIEVTNEGEQSYNVQLDAQEFGSGRQSYEQSLTVTPGERAAPPHLPQSEQQFRVRRIEDNEVGLVETAEITETSQLVRIRLHEERIELEVRERDGEANNTDADNETNTSADTDNETNDSADNEPN